MSLATCLPLLCCNLLIIKDLKPFFKLIDVTQKILDVRY